MDEGGGRERAVLVGATPVPDRCRINGFGSVVTVQHNAGPLLHAAHDVPFATGSDGATRTGTLLPLPVWRQSNQTRCLGLLFKRLSDEGH